MSLNFNGVEPSTVYLGGLEVSGIYVNKILVWGNSTWPGWDKASWVDIYNLCKAKQSGSITEWPADVVLGAVKSVNLTSPVLDSSLFNMRLIGIDFDGDGILTFSADNVTVSYTRFSSSTYKWQYSTAREVCKSIYQVIECKDYIKTLSKGTCMNYTGMDSYDYKTVYYSDETVWMLSGQEIGETDYTRFHESEATESNAECTYGVCAAYPYFDEQSKRIKYALDNTPRAYWSRSSMDNKSQLQIIGRTGDDSFNVYSSNYCIAPAFAIG